MSWKKEKDCNCGIIQIQKRLLAFGQAIVVVLWLASFARDQEAVGLIPVKVSKINIINNMPMRISRSAFKNLPYWFYVGQKGPGDQDIKLNGSLIKYLFK